MNIETGAGKQSAPHRSQTEHVDTASASLDVASGLQTASRELLLTELKGQMAILRGTVDQCFGDLKRMLRSEEKPSGSDEPPTPHEAARKQVQEALRNGISLPEGARLTWEHHENIEGSFYMRSGGHELRWRSPTDIYLRQENGKELLFINGGSSETIEVRVERQVYPKLTVAEHSEQFIAKERQRRVDRGHDEHTADTAAYNSLGNRVARGWTRLWGGKVDGPPEEKEVRALSPLSIGDGEAASAILKRTADYAGTASSLVRDLSDALAGIYDHHFQAASADKTLR